MKKYLFLSGCLFAACLFRNESVALTMGEAVERALQNDPVYLGAQADLGVSRARSGQAFSALMPQLSVSVSTMRNIRDYSQNTARGAPLNVNEIYNTDSAQLNLTQPLWHLDKFYAAQQADYVVAQSGQQLLSAGQDLLVRLAQAWFDIMQARDAVLLAQSQKELAEYQLKQATRAHDKGLMSMSDAELAGGKSEMAAAELAAAESQLGIRLAALEQIIGPVEMRAPPELPESAAIAERRTESLEHWEMLAREHNPAVQAARFALQAANEEVLKQYAGHGPTLDIVASHGKSAQGAGLTGGQAGFSTRTSSVGLQLNVPLFAGGGQVAKVREAIALKEKAAQEMERALRSARLSVKQDWLTQSSSDTLLLAAKRNIRATAFVLKGTEQGRVRGIKSDLDVLKAKVEHEGAVKDFRKAQYDALLSYFRLLAETGQLTGTHLARLDRFVSGR